MRAGSSAPRSRPRVLAPSRRSEARWGPRLHAIDAPSASLARSLCSAASRRCVCAVAQALGGVPALWQLSVVRAHGARQFVMYGSLSSARLASPQDSSPFPSVLSGGCLVCNIHRWPENDSVEHSSDGIPAKILPRRYQLVPLVPTSYLGRDTRYFHHLPLKHILRRRVCSSVILSFTIVYDSQAEPCGPIMPALQQRHSFPNDIVYVPSSLLE